MKCLVTGASGFIGSALTKSLREIGAQLQTPDRGQLDLAAGSMLAADLSGIQCVFHLAGIAHQQAALADYEQVNYRASCELARAAQAAGVKTFVFVSSVKAMGEPGPGHASPRVEGELTAPTDPYGLSKWRAEQTLREEFSDGPMSVVILRPALVYGDRAKGNLQSFLRGVKAGMPRPPALGCRSMIARQDLVALLLDFYQQPPVGLHTYNVCDGQRYSSQRLYDALRSGLQLSPGARPWPLWLWRLALAVRDGLGGSLGGGSYSRFFGTELYDNSALLQARAWRPTLQFEDCAAAMVAAGEPR